MTPSRGAVQGGAREAKSFYTGCCHEIPERETTANNTLLTIMAKSRQMRNLLLALRKTLSRAM